MSLPLPNNLTATGARTVERSRQIAIVKEARGKIVLRRREELLRNLNYMEAQIGRLAKMARDIRAEVLALTTE